MGFSGITDLSTATTALRYSGPAEATDLWRQREGEISRRSGSAFAQLHAARHWLRSAGWLQIDIGRLLGLGRVVGSQERLGSEGKPHDSVCCHSRRASGSSPPAWAGAECLAHSRRLLAGPFGREAKCPATSPFTQTQDAQQHPRTRTGVRAASSLRGDRADQATGLHRYIRRSR